MTHRARVRRVRLAGRLLAAVALALAALSGPLASAALASGDTAAEASATGWLRLAQLSPGAPMVDIYLDPVGDTHAMLVLRDVSYGMVSAYHAIPAGDYTVAMR